MPTASRQKRQAHSTLMQVHSLILWSLMRERYESYYNSRA